MSDIVLDEKLVDEFFKFYRQRECSFDTLVNLFKFFKPFHATREQIEKYFQDEEGKNLFAILLMQNGTPMWTFYTPQKDMYNASELQEEMVSHSNLKLFLTDNPYTAAKYAFRTINIKGDKIQLSYNQTFQSGSKRENAKRHIASFLRTASKIKIYDMYFNEERATEFCIFLCESNIPKSLQIEVYAGEVANNRTIEGIFIGKPNNFSRTTIKTYDASRRHDRYIEIDDKINIILTSGCEYLFKCDKDFTYIVTTK